MFPSELNFIEASPTSWMVMEQICARVSSHGGGALIIDYGSEEVSTPGGSLRGISNQKFVNPLERPGEVSLGSL